jgi:fructan beta-fructosidase
MTVPRQVTLRKSAEGYRILQAPVGEVASLHGSRQDFTATLGDTATTLPMQGGSADLEFAVDAGSSEQVAITLTDGEGYQTVVGINPTVDEVFVDRTRSGPHFHDGFANRHVAPVDLKSHRVKLRILADESILEVFINDGERTITDRFFRGGGPLRWSASSRGGNAQLKLTAWPMNGAAVIAAAK